ncbi:MAG: hypothetical protein ACRELC_05805 [Gemmatimonadota bacterium]
MLEVGPNRDDWLLIEAGVNEVRAAGRSVEIDVRLNGTGMHEIAASMRVPVGQTVVLGSARPLGRPALILTVRPELISLPDSRG